MRQGLAVPPVAGFLQWEFEESGTVADWLSRKGCAKVMAAGKWATRKGDPPKVELWPTGRPARDASRRRG